MIIRPTPESQHRKRHRNPDSALEDCWECQRDRATCRSKISFATREEVDEWVADLNAQRGYTGRVVTRYVCAWCPGWHFKTAKKKVELDRVKRAGRKALIAQRCQAPDIPAVPEPPPAPEG